MKIKIMSLFAVLGLLFLAAGCGGSNTAPTTIIIEEPAAVGVEQVAVFYRPDNRNALQEDINKWLRENSGRMEITRVLQSQSGSAATTHTIISIFYKRIK